MPSQYGDDTNNTLVGDPNAYGGDGNDFLKGTGAANQLYGGDGNDLLVDVFTLDATGSGDSAADPVRFNDNPGASGDDVIDGGSGRDVAYGFDGNDVIHGGEGDDGGIFQAGTGTAYFVGGLFGGDGKDSLYGGGGKDDLYGGHQKDKLYGGDDADTFFFEELKDTSRKNKHADKIMDFDRKEGDMIDLSAIDAKENKGGNQKFKYIGDHDFTKAGQVSFHNGKIMINTNNDSKAEAVIFVNTNKMTDDDFHL
jgi:Ca2+-binding RTX toxin-like protein